ncbi:F0F1 ATP synthase subunit A [Rhodococcus aerolatus]
MSAILLAAAEGGGYTPPSIEEFYPPAILFGGTIFEINRVMMVKLISTVALIGFFFLAFRTPRIVPRGLQNVGEIALDFVRVQIAEEILGKEQGRRFLPVIAITFFAVLAGNLTGVIPLLNISPNALIGTPLILAVAGWITFNVAGIRKFGFGGHLKNTVVVPDLPGALTVFVGIIEAISTFLIRPFTLTVRLLANMLAGHILLVLFFGATSYFLSELNLLTIAAPFTFLVGFAFTLFELLVIALQAYIFTLLVAVYTDLALNAH